MNETDLIRRARSGDRDAFATLVHRYKNTVYSVCYGFVRNRSEAEDLAQDVFLSVYRNLHTLREGRKLGVWIYRTAVNRSLNAVRKQRRPAAARLFSIVRKADEVQLDDLPGPDTADRKALDGSRMRLLRSALDSLPESQRSALTLHAIDEFSYRDIAEIMECSVAAVESRIHRARTALRKKLVKHIADLQ